MAKTPADDRPIDDPNKDRFVSPADGIRIIKPAPKPPLPFKPKDES